MTEHYNLHYLFLKDMERNPLSAEQSEALRKNIENFFKKKKPPWNSFPLISSEQKRSNNKFTKKKEKPL